MNRNTSDAIGNWIVYLGLGLAFLKTSEAMVPYAPRAVFGWQSDWVGWIWGLLAGALVEGVLYVAYIKFKDHSKDTVTKALAIVIALVSLGFSLTMNKIDQMVTDGVPLVIGSGDPLALLHNVVFAIPLVAAALFMVINAVDNHMPDRGQGKRGGGNRDSFQQVPLPQHARLEVAELGPDPLSLPSGNGKRQFTSDLENFPRISGNQPK